MGLSIAVEDWLPTRLSRASALAAIAATPIAWSIPHFASPLFPQATQVEILLAQATAALVILITGSFVTLSIVLTHTRSVSALLDAANLQLQALAQPGKHRNRAPIVRDHSQRLEQIREKVLSHVTVNPDQTSTEIAVALGLSEPIAQHHLEWLQAHSYVNDSLRLRGASGWARYEWDCEAVGRTYQATHGLLA